MPDITMCPGGKCPVKSRCYRFMATPTKERQSYFVETPPNDENGCRYYMKIWKDSNVSNR